jgi:hypothetical protein
MMMMMMHAMMVCVCVRERERGHWDGIRLTGLIENRSYGALTE